MQLRPWAFGSFAWPLCGALLLGGCGGGETANSGGSGAHAGAAGGAGAVGGTGASSSGGNGQGANGGTTTTTGSGGGSGGYTGTGGSIDCGTVPMYSPQCEYCAEHGCCAEMTTCAQNAECNALRVCGSGACDSACWSQCKTEHTAGVTDEAVFSACLASRCAVDCNIALAYSCGYAFDDPTCNNCSVSSCCDPVLSASLTPEFWNYQSCAGNCGTDQACQTTCQTTFPQGYARTKTILTCLKSACKAECGL